MQCAVELHVSSLRRVHQGQPIITTTQLTMRFAPPLLSAAALVSFVNVAQASSSWGFEEATVSVQGKGGSGGFKEKYVSARSRHRTPIVRSPCVDDYSGSAMARL